jgi:hypothetical protein
VRIKEARGIGMMKYDRLKENIETLCTHNERHIPVYHITDGKKHEIDLIREIVSDCREILDKIEQGTLIELPCKVGDTVYVIASCNDVDMYRIYEENRCECPFEYDCDYEDCDAKGTTLRIFDTKVTGIYSTVGYKGFFVEFEYLNVQYQLEDFGEKFFLTREEAEKRLKELQE